jgi:anti-sigma-K factor RsiG
VEEERAGCYRRRVLHGRIDLIRAELVRRGATTRAPEELVRVLMGIWRP